MHDNEVSLIVDDIIDTANATSDYFKKQIIVLSEKLKNNTLSDDEYEKITQSVALYQQYAAH